MGSTPSRVTIDATEELRTTGSGGAGTNVNISGVNGAAPAMSNPLPVELSDGTNPFGTAGNPLSVNVLSGGGSNASVGLTGNNAPASATEIGVVDGTGKLQNVTGLVLTNAKAATVAIVDANGNQITSFGSTANDLLDANNSSTTPLGANGVFTGTGTATIGYACVTIAIDTDQVSAGTATTGIVVQWSEDNANWADSDIGQFTSADIGLGQGYTFPCRRRYYRVVYTNGGTPQTFFRLQSILKVAMVSGATLDLVDQIFPNTHAQITRNLGFGRSSYGAGTFNDLTIKNPSTAPTATDPALVVAMSPSTPINISVNSPIGPLALSADILGQLNVNVQNRAEVVLTDANGTPILADDDGNLNVRIAAENEEAVHNIDVESWGDTPVSPAMNTSPSGTEFAPVVRPIQKKSSSTLFNGPLLNNATFNSPWVDTLQTGDLYIEASTFFSGNFLANGGFAIQGTDDPSNVNFLRSLAQWNTQSGGGIGAGQLYTLKAFIATRYWRVVVVNGGGGPQSSMQISATTACGATQLQQPGFTVYPNLPGSVTSSAEIVATQGSNYCASLIVIPTQATNTLNLGDANGNSAVLSAINAGQGTPVVGFQSIYEMLYNGATWDRRRTPAIFKTTQAVAVGLTPVWTPQAGKKFRLMKYQIILTDNAAADQSGVITLSFSDAATNLSISHDFFVPASVGSGSEYVGPWVDLENGILSSVANNVLNAVLSSPLRAGNFRINVCGTEE